MALDLGQDDFGDVFSCVRALFVLSTLSNFEPVVTQTYLLHPWSAVPFMFFMLVCGFFLMSVALGVVYDIYIEDHETTVADERKKLKKSMAKCFKLLDLHKTGVLEWRIFAEMMMHLRPHDLNTTHSYFIFREMAVVGDGSKVPKGVVGIDLDACLHFEDWAGVSFRTVDKKNEANLGWWSHLEYRYAPERVRREGGDEARIRARHRGGRRRGGACRCLTPKPWTLNPTLEPLNTTPYIEAGLDAAARTPARRPPSPPCPRA